MKIVIEISKYDREWIQNAYKIPEELRVGIAEEIINAKEQQTGEWIEYEPAKVYLNGEEVYAYMNNYTCSVCGGEAHIKYDYCPSCGAKMKD